MRRNSDRVMIAFHWLTALLVTVTFVIGWVHANSEAMEDLTARSLWLNVHRSLGLAILALTVARLLTRFAHGPANDGSGLQPALRIASRANHFLIYACLVAMPLLGWAQSSAMMRRFNVFGVAIPRLVRHDRDLADTLGWWHEQVGWLLLGLVALHAAAALFHHYVLRDRVLESMLPRRIAQSGNPLSPLWAAGGPQTKRKGM